MNQQMNVTMKSCNPPKIAPIKIDRTSPNAFLETEIILEARLLGFEGIPQQKKPKIGSLRQSCLI
jgi:hypothetical protein